MLRIKTNNFSRLLLVFLINWSYRRTPAWSIEKNYSIQMLGVKCRCTKALGYLATSRPMQIFSLVQDLNCYSKVNIFIGILFCQLKEIFKIIFYSISSMGYGIVWSMKWVTPLKHKSISNYLWFIFCYLFSETPLYLRCSEF